MARLVLLTGLTALFLVTHGAGKAQKAHPVLNNIGKLCRWQQSCMTRQQISMRRALAFVGQSRPAAWRIHLCNRNASRSRTTIDWFGFDTCIRNKALKRPRTG